MLAFEMGWPFYKLIMWLILWFASQIITKWGFFSAGRVHLHCSINWENQDNSSKVVIKCPYYGPPSMERSAQQVSSLVSVMVVIGKPRRPYHLRQPSYFFFHISRTHYWKLRLKGTMRVLLGILIVKHRW